MGLIRIIKDNYIIWRHDKVIDAYENGYMKEKDFIRLTKEYDNALRRESDRMFASFPKRYPREKYCSEKAA